jgi:hypothetical protein
LFRVEKVTTGWREEVMGERGALAPIFITDAGAVYVREGLVYIPYTSCMQEGVLITTPSLTMKTINEVLRTLRIDNVAALAPALAHQA